jgi:hypothetical protein
MISKITISTIILLACAFASRAQFSIPAAGDSTKLEVAPKVDSTIANPVVNNPYFSRGRWMAERAALRKERNTIEFNANLAATQTGFENWQAGGDNTFSARSSIFFHHLHKRDRFSIDYRLDARYGANYIEKRFFKNEDEWKVNLQTAWKMHRNWSYAATVNMRSQFSVGRKSRTDSTIVSKLMAPAFLDLSLGFNWKRDGSPWNVTFSPIAGSVTFVMDKQLKTMGINGVPKGASTKGQLGPSLRVFFDKQFAKNALRYRSNLYSFTNIRNAPTVRWENTFDIKATKMLTTTLYWLVYYDKKSVDLTQYNYSISVGISYWIKNK